MGRLRKGVGRGPERLLEAGAEDALRVRREPTVSRELLELDWDFNERSGSGEDDACFELMGLVSERVARRPGRRRLPGCPLGQLLCGGRGRRRASASRRPASSGSTPTATSTRPDITIEGYLDGMGLAMLTGGAWQAMVARIPGARPVPETAALLVGARDFDEPEKVRLDESDVALVEAERLRDPEALLEAIDGLDPEPSGLYLHVDLDVLDSEEARVNVYSAPGGRQRATSSRPWSPPCSTAATCGRCR